MSDKMTGNAKAPTRAPIYVGWKGPSCKTRLSPKAGSKRKSDNASAPAPPGRKWPIGLAAIVLMALAGVTAQAAGETRENDGFDVVPGRAGGFPGARGIVKAVHQAAMSTELLTPIASIPLREGSRFAKGDLLIEMDCRRQRHELAALAAVVAEMKVTVDSNEHLASRGAANRNDVVIARARHDKSKAEWAAMSARLSGCRITAAFDGVVTEIAVNAFEVPQPNRPIITVVSDRALEIEIIVASRLLGALGPGSTLTFRIDESGASHEARVLRSAGAVDPVSQTSKIYAAFIAPVSDVLPGMSGTASLGLIEGR